MLSNNECRKKNCYWLSGYRTIVSGIYLFASLYISAYLYSFLHSDLSVSKSLYGVLLPAQQKKIDK